MESIGQVNRYAPRLTTGQQRRRVMIPKPLMVINLCNGTTPFIHFQEHGKEVYEYVSQFYKFLPAVLVVEVTHGHYRPSPKVFNSDLLHEDEREFVLGGALLLAPLPVAIERQLKGDKVVPTWNCEQYRTYTQKVYGRQAKRLPGT